VRCLRIKQNNAQRNKQVGLEASKDVLSMITTGLLIDLLMSMAYAILNIPKKLLV